MFHVLVYFSSVPAGLEFSDVTALDDGVFGKKNDHYLYGSDLKLILGTVLCSGTDLQRLQVVTPTLRSIGYPMLRPWNVGTNTPDDPNLAFMIQHAPILKQQEEISVQAIAGAATAVYVVLFVTEGLRSAPDEGDVITIQAKFSTTVTAQTWTTLSPTLPGDGWFASLPKGRYAVVGSECISTTAVAHRLLFDNQIFRPGALSSTSVGNRTHRVFYDGMLGTWGTFVSQVPPRIEVLCDSADSSHSIFLQVVRLPD